MILGLMTASLFRRLRGLRAERFGEQVGESFDQPLGVRDCRRWGRVPRFESQHELSSVQVPSLAHESPPSVRKDAIVNLASPICCPPPARSPVRSAPRCRPAAGRGSWLHNRSRRTSSSGARAPGPAAPPCRCKSIACPASCARPGEPGQTAAASSRRSSPSENYMQNVGRWPLRPREGESTPAILQPQSAPVSLNAGPAVKSDGLLVPVQLAQRVE